MRSEAPKQHDLAELPWNEQVVQALNDNEPLYCECVRTGKRSLSWAVWVPGFSSSKDSLFDRQNLEFSHEHLIWEESGANVGFGPDGLFGEEIEAKNYRIDSTCYDGSLMRKALQYLDLSKPYNFIKNNCQDFISRAFESYRALQR